MNNSARPLSATITIDNITFQLEHGDVTGQELRELTTPAATELWLDLPDAQDVPVLPNSTITVSGDLRFFTNTPITIYIDSAPFRVPAGAVTEQKLRELTSPAIPEDHRIWKDIYDDLDDPITEDEIIIIKNGDRFFTKAPEPTTFEIRVNTAKHTVSGSVVSFETIVALAFPAPPTGSQLIFTVGYTRGAGPRPTGTLRAGETVTIKNGTIFNVTATDKS
ncbi:multiubiquitin domain-containing protein [Cryobacterium sp. PH29-G1]|uniref:multiubiquitin domain-containing protein n=1 Tax=Cryobacterium sp. PH29-G1 TaxID=3046211 RepID=UPI0024BACB0A|nr:multiubiquitin domain-containing protein [Cryobacterium sp. PH29-G1]MDJ0350581.1 multiubiquitin domain-containing protein [Cryobacterium sp. PH29-G1]